MSTPNDKCPLCGEGHLEACTDYQPIDYKGLHEQIPYYFAVCNTCGTEQTDPALLRKNKRELIAFKKRADNLLAGGEVKSVRKKYGLRQSEAAKIFGGGPTAFSKYESNDVMQSESMDNLLRVAMKFPEVVAFLAQKVGLEPKNMLRHDIWLSSYRSNIVAQLMVSNKSQVTRISLRERKEITQFNFGEAAANGDQFDTELAL